MREIDVERGTWGEEVERLRSRAELAERKKEIKHRLLTRKFEREQVQTTNTLTPTLNLTNPDCNANPNRNPNPNAIPNPDRLVVSVPCIGHVCLRKRRSAVYWVIFLR